MTDEEEVLVKEFLLHHGETEDDDDFELWYLQCFENSESETHYKHTLHLATVWKGRFEEGFKTGASYKTVSLKQPDESTALPL